MILKNGSFSAMANDIKKNDNRIIIFGTGVVGSTVTPEIMNQYGINNLVECCIDNDKTKWNTTISMFGRDVPIKPPDILYNCTDKVTILITISRYQSVYEQLLGMRLNDNISCYIIPSMCAENFHNNEKKGVIKTNKQPIIPKIIHYMWLGATEIPDALKRCIDSWQKFCPDYEIIRWDESNYDVHKNGFVSQAYDNHMYGFVPDYARIELLYEYGGIYLDTDVELLRNLDDFLYQESFCSVEKWQVLNFGGCSGVVKGHKSLEPFLESWRNRKLIRDDGTLDRISSGWIDTTIALKQGYVINGKNQTVNGMNIYTYDYFHPYDYMSGKLEMTDDTYAVHHFNGGWLDDRSRNDNQRTVELYQQMMDHAIVVGNGK